MNLSSVTNPIVVTGELGHGTSRCDAGDDDLPLVCTYLDGA